MTKTTKMTTILGNEAWLDTTEKTHDMYLHLETNLGYYGDLYTDRTCVTRYHHWSVGLRTKKTFVGGQYVQIDGWVIAATNNGPNRHNVRLIDPDGYYMWSNLDDLNQPVTTQYVGRTAHCPDIVWDTYLAILKMEYPDDLIVQDAVWSLPLTSDQAAPFIARKNAEKQAGLDLLKSWLPKPPAHFVAQDLDDLVCQPVPMYAISRDLWADGDTEGLAILTDLGIGVLHTDCGVYLFNASGFAIASVCTCRADSKIIGANRLTGPQLAWARTTFSRS